jgi:multisubunit Na+/H+ antiporter MnhC subunit
MKLTALVIAAALTAWVAIMGAQILSSASGTLDAAVSQRNAAIAAIR